MLKKLYKKILQKLDLSRDQLKELESKLNAENICAGPFIENSKMCPNTTALSIKTGGSLKDNSEIRKMLNKKGVNNADLFLFYVFFDLPAKLSKNKASSLINTLKKATKDLIHT